MPNRPAELRKLSARAARCLLTNLFRDVLGHDAKPQRERNRSETDPDSSRDSRSAGLVALRSWDAFLLVVTCTSAGIVDALPRHEDPVVCSDGASRLAEKCHV